MPWWASRATGAQIRHRHRKTPGAVSLGRGSHCSDSHQSGKPVSSIGWRRSFDPLQLSLQSPGQTVPVFGHHTLLFVLSNPLHFSELLRIFTHMSNIVRKVTEKSREPADRLMTVRQLAAYLNLNERTVLKLVSEGELPGVKIGNQWRFRKAMLDAWLDDQMLGVTPRSVDIPRGAPAARRMLNLGSCFQPSHIAPDLEANTKTCGIEELANLANPLHLVRA